MAGRNAAAPDLKQARDRATTPFDYIVVGSGAGGGPLAASLALAGKRVLVLEAGLDPAVSQPAPGDPVTADAFMPETFREVSQVPAYHGPATEDPEISWEFSVRHFEDDTKQGLDSKYNPARDPAQSGKPGKGGIQYPRSSSLGGCTAHHAMIVVKPNDADWTRIAKLTGDASWGPGAMQGYFARIEKCLYYTEYQGFLRRTLGILYTSVRKLFGLINPRYQLDWGGHGYAGWQTTSFIDPVLIAGIARGDRTFLRVLFDVIWFLLRQKGAFSVLKQAVSRLQVIQYLDPNFRSARGGAHGQLAFIPIGTDGKRRSGVRERLLETAGAHPDCLVLLTGVLATRVIFDRPDPNAPPRAVGVEVAEGTHLYEASPLSAGRQGRTAPKVAYFAKGEVVLAGGSFNTPQLLMLSGIGEKSHLEQHKIEGPRDQTGKLVADIVDLPGVGRNLQDRYEVSVISQTKRPFSTLKGVSFVPSDANDPARQEWLKSGTGLYSTNGGALAIFVKSSRKLGSDPEKADPDLFIFGVPAAFRGYYWSWAKELLRETKGAAADQRDLWSWIILEAYTSNRGGTVRLRSSSPFAQPEINFHSFGEGPAGYEQDLDALADGVAFVRRMNARVKPFKREIQPGDPRANGTTALREWLRNEAWGHHACGTCRMGSDRWQADVSQLLDENAVLDSQFRVHGVSNLRVVDASVFPEIPGYFIVTPVFMVSEKAADTLLADSKEYPQALESAEATAIRERRERARRLQGAGPPAAARPPAPELPADTVGLALSGGGIRSATFCLGVLQALAGRNKLRDVDIMSTVSGGGYIGAFLGRCFTRVAADVKDKVGQVQDKLSSTSSPEVAWLRAHANYLSGEGRSDVKTNVAAVWRNLLAVHLCIGILLVALFAGLRWLSGDSTPAEMGWLPAGTELSVSPWWRLPVLVFVVGVVPIWCGFWIAPLPGSTLPHPVLPLFAWLALLAGAIAAMAIPGASLLALVALGALLLAWLTQELAQMSLRSGTKPEMYGLIARNRLTRALASALLLLGFAALWVVLDTLARTAASHKMMPPVAGSMALVAATLPFLRLLAIKLASKPAAAKSPLAATAGRAVVGALAFLLAGFLLFALDVIAHSAFEASDTVGMWLFFVTLLVSVALGRAIGFANLSSLQPLYGGRLVRTFLGASSDARIGTLTAEPPTAVQEADADDDVAFEEYHPEQNGGPLHLINVCVNETVDAASGRHLRQDKGLSMCVGPCGVSVGMRFHALWEKRGVAHEDLLARMTRLFQKPPESQDLTALRPLPVAADPNTFHVLAHGSHKATAVESLRLGHWMSISGAALSTGSGRSTSLPLAVLLGLFNARLGYWWNSGINPGDRPGRYPPSFLRRVKGIPGWVFRAQSIILNEWRAYFGGPSQRLWFLSDGGHFDNSGLYELVRRRLAFVIAVDAGHDPDYQHGGLALLVRRARQDFGAHFSWIDPSAARSAGAGDWQAIEQAAQPMPPPAWIKAWINPNALGPVWKIERAGAYTAALARVTYDGDAGAASWLLLIKAGLMVEMPLDVRRYSAAHPVFPNQSTFDQFLDDDQWESYRLLGECAGRAIFK